MGQLVKTSSILELQRAVCAGGVRTKSPWSSWRCHRRLSALIIRISLQVQRSAARFHHDPRINSVCVVLRELCGPIQQFIQEVCNMEHTLFVEKFRLCSFPRLIYFLHIVFEFSLCRSVPSLGTNLSMNQMWFHNGAPAVSLDQ